MRPAHLGCIALVLCAGCLRFSYDAERMPQTADKRDASMDAATSFDASIPDARVRDAEVAATMPDAAGHDAATRPADGGSDAAASQTDAALPDAQVPLDAATPDAGPDAGGTDPCLGRSAWLFCSSFEDSALAGWGTTVENNAAWQPTTERKRSGSYSLHAATDAAPSGVVIARREVDVFKHQTSGELWSRAYYYLPDGVAVDAASSIATLRMSGTEVPSFGCSLVIRTDFVELGGVATASHTSSPFPRNRWTCVELHIVIDASTGICEAYVDSLLAAQSPQVDTVPGNGYDLLSVGFSYSNPAQGAFDLYFDDVAASTSRIGCD